MVVVEKTNYDAMKRKVLVVCKKLKKNYIKKILNLLYGKYNIGY